MNFVIGDIHGEITKLKLLIKQISLIDNMPSLIFIGDYLDKGENVRQTLSYTYELAKQYPTIFLIGNHEYLWLNLVNNNQKDTEIEKYLLKYGAKMTLHSFSSNNLLETRERLLDDFQWLFQSLIPHYLIEDYLIVHSGLKPVDFIKAPNDINLKDKLFNRYDFIRNENLYLNKYKIIFGHTGFYAPYVDHTKIGIDTAACFLPEQPLTAFCIEGGFFINSLGSKVQLKEVPDNFSPNIPRNRPWRYE